MKSFKYLQGRHSARLFWFALLCMSGLLNAHAQISSSSSAVVANSAPAVDSTSSSSSVTISAEASDTDADVESDDHDNDKWGADRWHKKNRHRNELVSIGHGVTLREGEHADSVVAILGAIRSDGEVVRDVVSVAGNARITGPVGHDVVSVLGNVYINSTIGHDVVVTMGNVELGPQAVINGRLINHGGDLSRDAAAVIRGDVVGATFGHNEGFAWFRPWIDNCLKYGRPLAIAPGLGWAWSLALFSLLTYVITALLSPRTVHRCVTTLETSPGYSLLTALLAMLGAPILFVLLIITVVGIVAIPFLGIAMLTLGFYGKLVMLAWIGQRSVLLFNKDSREAFTAARAAMITLIGGLLVMLLYLVPVVGFVLYKLLGIVGFGVVVYTLILRFKDKHRPQRQTSQQYDVHGATSGNDSASDEPFIDRSNTTADAMAADNFSANSTNTQTAQTTTTELASLPRATFWTRMGALLVDVVLVAFILNLIFHFDDILLLTVALYGALMWKFRGTTIGGILFNLRVVRLDGRELDWPTVIVRALSCFLSLIALGIGFVWMAFDPERQAWHDKIAGTIVVRTPNGMSLV